MAARRVAHWTAVAVFGVIGMIGFQTVAHKFPQLGLAKLANFAGGGSQ